MNTRVDQSSIVYVKDTNTFMFHNIAEYAFEVLNIYLERFAFSFQRDRVTPKTGTLTNL